MNRKHHSLQGRPKWSDSDSKLWLKQRKIKKTYNREVFWIHNLAPPEWNGKKMKTLKKFLSVREEDSDCLDTCSQPLRLLLNRSARVRMTLTIQVKTKGSRTIHATWRHQCGMLRLLVNSCSTRDHLSCNAHPPHHSRHRNANAEIQVKLLIFTNHLPAMVLNKHPGATTTRL